MYYTGNIFFSTGKVSLRPFHERSLQPFFPGHFEAATSGGVVTSMDPRDPDISSMMLTDHISTVT